MCLTVAATASTTLEGTGVCARANWGPRVVLTAAQLYKKVGEGRNPFNVCWRGEKEEDTSACYTRDSIFREFLIQKYRFPAEHRPDAINLWKILLLPVTATQSRPPEPFKDFPRRAVGVSHKKKDKLALLQALPI